jgi:hypothetical protein
MTQQQPQICPVCKKDQVSSALAKDGRTRICWTCKEEGK